MINLTLAGDEAQFRFEGAYQNLVELTLFPSSYLPAGHVVALALYRQSLLFTKHKTRGMEWPGGKVEQGETPLQAIIREVKEETGAIASSVWLIGQYKVIPKEAPSFIKNIYVVLISHFDDQPLYEEDSRGPVFCDPDVEPTEESGFSPLVCDGVFQRVRKYVLQPGTSCLIQQLNALPDHE